MRRIALPGRGEPVFGPDEAMRVSVDVETKGPVAGMSLRLTFRTQSDVALGTSWSEPFDLGDAGVHRVLAELPTGTVARGVAYVSVGVYRTDEVGRRLAYDHVSRVLRVEFMGAPTWYLTAYGHIRMPAAAICEVSAC